MNEFLILGCGHSESLEHYNNNAAVINNQGVLLIDCGHTIKHALRAQDMSIESVDAIFITHVHGDHVFGLERVAFEARYKYQKRISLYFHESIYQELWDQTLKGSLGYSSDHDGTPQENTLEDWFDVNVITGNKFSVFGNNYKIFEVKHSPGKPTFGLTINDTVFFSSDTTQIKEIIENTEFQIGFHDVTLTKFNPVHASLSSLVESYSKEVRDKLYLMSYQDDWAEYKDMVEDNFKGFAKQGMKVDL